jgi:hypothetical protein
MNETPFMAQRRTLQELRDKQDAEMPDMTKKPTHPKKKKAKKKTG